MAYTFRHPDDGDIWRIFDLMEQVAVADEGEFDFTRDDMEIAWKMSSRENAWIVEAEDGSAVAFAGIHERHPTRLRTFTGVVPEHRGNGIGSRLLDLLDERGRELARKVTADEPVWLSVSAGHHNTDAAPLFEQKGFEFARVFWKMGIELVGEPPEPEIPAGIVFEPMRPGSEREIFDASEEAFQDHWDHAPHNYDEWRAWMIDRDDFDPGVWVVARDGDEIAGASINTNEDAEAWVAVLFVRRPWRRRGLGLALLQASLREFWKRGVPKAALGVDAENPTGATRLYERAGMQVVREERMYRKDVRHGEA
jgi:mycothiol synthase